jgi:photosystem II stability/assembly factor-like uncharacterized protein
MCFVIKFLVLAIIIVTLLGLVPGCGCPSDEPIGPGPTDVESTEEALAIAAKFCPVIHLNADQGKSENFQPDSVQLMVDLSLLRDLDDPAFSEKPTMTSLLEWSLSRYYLDVPGLNPQTADVAQYKAAYDLIRDSYRPTVYARVVYCPGHTVVQYWLFYYLNDWRNVHEGDWELVQLDFPERTVRELLDEDISPVFAAYSQHQSGQHMSWSDMVDGGLVRDNHPFVYVARGSHANYFTPGQFWSGLDFDDTGTSAWREIDIDQIDIILLSEIDTADVTGLEWLDFRGYWGEYVGFSISVLDLRFWQHGPFGPQWSDEGQIGEKWYQPGKWADSLPEYPSPFWTSFLKKLGNWPDLAVFHLFSPAELHVYDGRGRHIGLDEKGEVDIDIPNAYYIQPEGTDYKIILVPGADAADEYRIEVKGTDTGMMDIKAQVPDYRIRVSRFLEYTGVPVSPSLIARAYIRPDLAGMEAAAPAVEGLKSMTAQDKATELEIDENGDGVFDFKSRPGRFSLDAVIPVSSEDVIPLPENNEKTEEQVTEPPVTTEITPEIPDVISGPLAPAANDRDSVFNSMAIDPLNPQVVYVGTERNGLFRSVDGGKTWQWLRRGLSYESFGYPEFYDTALSPLGSKDAVYFATTNGPEPIDGDFTSIGGIYRISGGGDTFRLASKGLGHANVQSIAVNPNNPDNLVAALGTQSPTRSQFIGQVFPGGIYYSTDGGDSWHEASMPDGSDMCEYHQIYAYGSNRTTFITYGQFSFEPEVNLGFLKSTDGGKTWTKFGPFGAGDRIYFFTISSDGQVIYAYEYSDQMKQVHKSGDGGKSWKTFDGPFFGKLKASPTDPSLVLYIGFASQADMQTALYKSTDGLSTSVPVLETKNKIDDIEFAPSSPDIVYLATEGYDIYKSTDAGNTWTYIINLRSAIINAND